MGVSLISHSKYHKLIKQAHTAIKEKNISDLDQTIMMLEGDCDPNDTVIDSLKIELIKLKLDRDN